MKNKINLMVVFFSITAVFLIAFFIYPIYKNIKNTSEDILLYKGKVILLNVQNKELNDFKIRYKNNEFNLEKIDQIFVDAQNPVDFIEFLEDTAVSAGINAGITLEGPPKKKEAGDPVIMFQIFAKGNFSNILVFSEKLENSPYLIKISTLSIKKQQSSSSKQIISDEVDATFLIEVVVKDKSNLIQ